MFEIEKQTDKNEEIRDWRSSDYISISFSPNTQAEFIATTYYQPLFRDFSDYRLLSQCIVKVRAGNHFFINLNWNYQFDSRPAADVPEDTYAFSTGLEYIL